MTYHNASIAETLDALNRTHYLPAIQREFVWDPGRIVMLFDSILRGYPISSFLYWNLKPDNASAWEFYDFIKHGSDRGVRNRVANVSGVPSLIIVLDGQQRLTSLLLGLRGSYEFKKKYMWWDNPAAWETRLLYLDILKDPASLPDDGEEGIRYGLEFKKKPPEQDAERYWVQVGEILRCDSESAFETYRAKVLKKVGKAGYGGDRRVPERNLDCLYRAVWRDQAIAYHVETDQDYDRVLDIFVRANQGAIQLSKSDLLLSMMTARWTHKNARNEVYDFVDRLNKNMPLPNDVDKDFVMKSCLVLSDLPVAYQVKNFNRANLQLIADNWSRIKAALEKTVKLVNKFGISRDTLTSANALIPVAYYFMQHPQYTLQGSSSHEADDAAKVHEWVLISLLNNLFGGQSDRALNAARQAMQKSKVDGFPRDALIGALEAIGRRPRFDSVALENFLRISFGDRDSFLALSLLYDAANWGHTPYQQDHIVPQALFGKKHFDALGFDQERRDRYVELSNRIGNLELLTESENHQKQAQDFGTWLATRGSDFRKMHLIPKDDSLLDFERFEEFVAAREQLISDRLAGLFGRPAPEGVE